MSDNISQDTAIRGEGNIVVGKGNVIINPLPPAETRLRYDLGILLKNVKNTWIKGVLEKSVHEAALLELGIELRQDAIDNPWRMVMEGPDQMRQMIPRGRKIKETFEEANRLLLILGEPGSGKTTTLLQLARDLIAEVDQTFAQPIPVIFNLSTWTSKQQSLDDWLVLELNSKYRLPKKDGLRWLRERRILPLMDGLDEVKAENRAACVEKINQLVSDYGLQGLVVCSRMNDYAVLDVRLAFYRAVYLQPLSPEQVDEYLVQAGDKLASLRQTLQADEALRNMARSPLILNIMSLAYQNAATEDLSNPILVTDKARRWHLFNTYIARMLSRQRSARHFSAEQTRQYLSWLAGNMQRHNQEVFFIESLQPSWLTGGRWQWLYVIVSRMVVGLILGLSLSSENIWFFILGLSVGISVGLIDILRFEWLRKRRWLIKLTMPWWSVANVIADGMIIGLMIVLIELLNGLIEIDKAIISQRDWRTLLLNGLLYGSLFGLFFGLRGSRQNLDNDIQTVEALHWSWSKALRGGLIGAVGGLIFGVLFWLILYGLNDRLFSFGPIFSMLFGLVGAMLNGLRTEIMETKSTPNEGIQLSIRNAVVGGLTLGLIFGFSLGPFSGPWLTATLFLGLICGLAGALWYGGLDVIQHYVLRLILVIQGHIPTNYARFLDHAVDHIFLQKVGGGYRFLHRLLLEHFIDLGEMRRISFSNKS